MAVNEYLNDAAMMPTAAMMDAANERTHPLIHFCRKCMSLGKVMFVAFVVEVLMFYPTHLLFHELGWL